MGLKIWLNDRLVDESEAMVSVFDHELLYGDGVFEGIRVYGSKVFEHKAHIDRLYDSAKALRMTIPVDADTLMGQVENTVQANGIEDGYIRLVITRGIGDLGLNPWLCKKPQVIVIAAHIQLYPKEIYENGLKVISSSVVRNSPQTLSPQIKSLNYLNNIMAKVEALDNNVLEAIMYNHEGYVAEATADNIFVVKDGVIFTPPTHAGALSGITRSVVMKLAGLNGFKVLEENLTRYDLYTADEMFLTGTGAEVIGIVDIDGRKVGTGRPGEITRELLREFEEYVRK